LEPSWTILNGGIEHAYLRSVPEVPAIDLRALGPFEAEVDGATVELGSRIQRCVLALLTASFGKTVSADRIISEVWGGSPPAKPSQSLQTYVSNLRRLLGRETIETRDTGYRLMLGAESVDVERFRDAFSTVAAADGGPTEVESTLERALDLWRGSEPYQSLADEVPLLREESTRLKEMRLTAIERLYEVRLHLGKHADVIPELQVLTTEHPYRERMSGLLMKALYAAGRQAEALGVYRELRTRLVEELGIEPSPDLQELEIRILTQTEKVHTPRRGKSRLPHYPTKLVGRDDDLESLQLMLGDHRIVTVTGPAGVGKTRIAVAVGHQLIEAHPDGVLFADLSTIDSGADIAKAVMAGSGLTDQSIRSPEHVVADFLADRVAMLVLDNCEHVAASASELVWSWVTNNPELTVLSTSRQSLGLTGEKVFALTPLPTNTPGQQSPSARLFLQRAQETDPGLQPSEKERQLVDEICRRLDGIPLAIELAAARLQTLTLEELNDALDERLHLLSSRRGSEPDRHAALLDSLDWSYNLLDADQQSLFESLSILNGSFSLEVAGAVGGIQNSTVVIDLVDHLVNCSLIQRDKAEQRSHFRMLETMRLFGRARLEEHGGLETAEERRAEHFAAFAAEQAQLIKGYEHLKAVEMITNSLDNMRPAFTWSLDKGRLDLAFTLTRPLWALVFVGARRHLHEGQEWRERLVRVATDGSMKARLLAESAFASFVLGDQKRATALAEESLSVSDAPSSKALALEALALCAATNRETAKATALAETVLELDGDEHDAHGLEALAFAQIFGGNPGAAVDTVEQVFEQAHRRGDPLRHIRALALMGAALQGTDLDRSRDFLDEAVARTEELGMEWDLAGAVMARSLTHLMAGRIPEALDDLERAAALTYDVGDNRRLAQTLEILGSILAQVDHGEEAVEMLSAARELRRLSDVIGSEDEAGRRQSALTHLETALGPERFNQAMAKGSAASPDKTSSRAVELTRAIGSQLRGREVRQ
jgi:predicted ATPase/DNA-binding SARP family transcriptional activator